jgi:hypothetical protein
MYFRQGHAQLLMNFDTDAPNMLFNNTPLGISDITSSGPPEGKPCWNVCTSS